MCAVRAFFPYSPHSHLKFFQVYCASLHAIAVVVDGLSCFSDYNMLVCLCVCCFLANLRAHLLPFFFIFFLFFCNTEFFGFVFIYMPASIQHRTRSRSFLYALKTWTSVFACLLAGTKKKWNHLCFYNSLLPIVHIFTRQIYNYF